MTLGAPPSRLAAKQQEQIPQALARLIVICLFIVLWCLLWVARIPMPGPFLVVLVIEAVFFLVYWRAVFLMPRESHVAAAHYFMLAAEIVFHTTMVYFLGGVTWLGALAYVFGLIFANTYLDLRRGFVYTAGVVGAFVALAILDTTGTVPHHAYLEQGRLGHGHTRLLVTTIIGGSGVFFSIYLWVNWVGHQLREERDSAVRIQDALYVARSELERANSELEGRVRIRTKELESVNLALSESGELLRATIESTADGILVVDSDGHVSHSNERFADMWRVPADAVARGDDSELLDLVVNQLTEPEAFLTKVAELYGTTEENFDTLIFKDGRAFERFSRPLMRAGDPAGRVWSFRDVTERKRAEDALRRQAERDPLTDLLNHAAITKALRAQATEAPGTIAIVLADIDGMKAVNDTYGHLVGDCVLNAVGRTLQACGGIVGRYGGDEFLVVLAKTDRTAGERYCQQVLQDLAVSYVNDPVTGSSIPVRASIGLAIYPLEAATVEDAIRLADSGMYAEKRERTGTSSLSAGRRSVGDERVAKMIGEVVPILTAPGDLGDKLKMVAHRLALDAGYDIVRFSTPTKGDPFAAKTFARAAPGLIEAWDEERAAFANSSVAELLQRTQRPVLVDDLHDQRFFSDRQRQLLEAAGVKATLIVPMLWQGDLVGVLSVATNRAGGLDARDAQFLTTVADQVTAIIRMESLVDDLQAVTTHLEEARSDTVILLAAAAEAHEQTTGRHLVRVQRLSELLAMELGYDAAEAQAIGLAAVLHDIGKIRVPESILLSPSRLDGANWELMKQHTVWGSEFLAARPGFELAAAIASAHHERWDGKGYPRGIAGTAIPEAATIVSVADSLDAITNDRPYRAGRPVSWAVDEIARCSGTQFSPRVVDALLRLHKREALQLEDLDQDRTAA